MRAVLVLGLALGTLAPRVAGAPLATRDPNAVVPAVVVDVPDTTQDPAEDPAPSTDPAAGLPEATARVVERRVRDLPRAEPGTWAGWLQRGGPDPEVADDYRAAAAAYAREDLPACLRALYAVLEARPDYPAALHLLGVAHFRLRRHGDCVEAFERFLVHAPESVGRTRHLGHARYELGRFDEALAHYDRVLEAAPGDLEARRGRALTRLRSGDPDGALEDLDAVLAARPDHGEARYWRARALFERDGEGDLEAAEGALERAAERLPFDPRVPFLRAQVWAELGRDADAEAARVRYRELEAIEGRARGLRARLLYEPGRADLLQELAALHLAAGDRARAAEVLGRLVAAAEASGDEARAGWARAQLGVLRLGR